MIETLGNARLAGKNVETNTHSWILNIMSMASIAHENCDQRLQL